MDKIKKEVTAQMICNFINGGAAINTLARHVGARVVVVDMGVATKIQNSKPAMTREEAIKSIQAGIEIFEEELLKGINIIGTGDMGIGNTTSSSAIAACF